MYMNPEMALIIAAQRSEELQAKAEAWRKIAEGRAARRSDRARPARLRWARRITARRPALGYSSPRNA